MKQGLALQLDLYNLKSLNKDVSGNALTDFGVMENADSASGVFCTKTGYRDFASTANVISTVPLKLLSRLPFIVNHPFSQISSLKILYQSAKTDKSK